MQGVSFELDESIIAEDEEREALQDIINNTKLNEGYLTLARDIEVMEPKSPEDIYKVGFLGYMIASCTCTFTSFFIHVDKHLTSSLDMLLSFFVLMDLLCLYHSVKHELNAQMKYIQF